MAAFQLIMNVPVIGVLNVSAAEAFAYQDALIPIEAFATAIAIGSGIVASQSQAAMDGASEMLRKAVANMKAKACLDSNTEFRVIDGGKPRKPQKGDDKNNRKWFTIAAGSVATGSLIAGLKASREMMQEIYEQNGFEKVNKITNMVSIADVSEYMSFSYIKRQAIDSHYPGIVTQINHIEDKINKTSHFNLSDYYYSLSYQFYSDGYYPDVELLCFKKSDVEYFNPTSFTLKHYKFTSNSINYSSYYPDPGYIGNFLNADNVYSNVGPVIYFLSGHYHYGGTPTVLKGNFVNDAYYSYAFSNSGSPFVPFGFIGGTIANYDFTNQIYNNSQSQQANFPDWLQQSIETLNGNLTGLNLAINNLQLPQTWNDTQKNIQTGTAPANVINQYINNWSNPEQAPDPEPEPDPGPNPDPDPEPEPGQQPAAEAAVEEAGQGLFDWSMSKVKLPDGFFDKLPFSIPYDIYLLLKSLFPSNSGGRMVYSVRAHSGNIGDTDPSGLTISSNFDASGISTRKYVASSGGSGGTSNKWVDNAPLINLDIHWKYHDVQGNVKTIDIVKTVDLSSIGYFAMIIYISVYVFWFFNLLHWLMGSFKG